MTATTLLKLSIIKMVPLYSVAQTEKQGGKSTFKNCTTLKLMTGYIYEAKDHARTKNITSGNRDSNQ